jgi:molybdenum cofactor cytidylyltransferase
MFASLSIALGRLIESDDWQVAAILPVDHPLVRSETVGVLARAKSDAAIPSYSGKHGHPICMARSVVQSIVEGVLAGPTLRDVLRSVESVDVPVEDVGVISNCNTPEALRHALGRLSS